MSRSHSKRNAKRKYFCSETFVYLTTAGYTTAQMASGNISLCPVCAAAAIVHRIQLYPGVNNNTPISAIWIYERINHITSKQISNALQDAILAIGEDTLHIAKNEIGTHSIRLGAAMAMYLRGCSVFLIMMIRHWSSNAFLRFIRKQVEEFNHDVLQNANTYAPQAHSKLFIPNSFKPRSQATQSSRQYRDTKQCRGECGLASQASCFHTISLSSTIERQETHFIYFSQSQQTTPSHTDP